MNFTVLTTTDFLSAKAPNNAYLLIDDWDDYFEFSTLYKLFIIDVKGITHNIGGLKIGQFNMVTDQRKPSIPIAFNSLSKEFFSVGQDDSYYQELNNLGEENRKIILDALNDIAADDTMYNKAIHERVTQLSLFRFVSPSTVKGQFRRMANGGARLSHFSFSYQLPKLNKEIELVTLTFNIEPDSNPPTNVHVLIGRNGVGKTYTINKMIGCLVDPTSNSKTGMFNFDTYNSDSFANLISVTFSAFDESEPIPENKDNSSGIRYSYVGLKRIKEENNPATLEPKTPIMLKDEFVNSVTTFRTGVKQKRWVRALEVLGTDPIFESSDIRSVLSISNEHNFKKETGDIFNKLSSGHKIVLLTITRLVETVEEKSLVLLDEPEAHLHPPLLSAFIRALSDLLIERNGVAIIATHSPVVLQEVPRSCVWMLRRTGSEVNAERLEIESFGENVGILTREVFGLEVIHSGFHKILSDSVKSKYTYEEALYFFNQQLGMEAKAILRALYSKNTQKDV
ncbi:MAG: AAA family ATPase [Syntrophothermus sp.]